MRFSTTHHCYLCQHWRTSQYAGCGTCDVSRAIVSHLHTCDKFECVEIPDKAGAVKKDGNFDNLIPEREK